MKRWLSTFDEEPSPAALPAAGSQRHLDERMTMRCQHVNGHQRRGSVRIGGCSSRTGVVGDRIQNASVGSARACHSDKTARMSSNARRRRRPAPAGAAKRRKRDLVTGNSFLHGTFIVERAVISHALQ